MPLAGCQSGGSQRTGGLLDGSRYMGTVVADEAHAVLAARELLEARGSAADAAAALAFTLAVTHPSAAGLGGGGQCLVYVRLVGGDRVASLDFMPGPTAAAAGGGWASAVPGTVRGMDVLQARYGRLSWARTLVAAERLARFGHPVSRALASDLAAGGDALLGDAAARAVFGRSDGRAIAAGETLVQRDLAALLERLRLAGADDFYTGSTARRLAGAAAGAGGSLRAEDLQRYRARWGDTAALAFDDWELHTVPGGGGAVAAAIWGLAGADDRYADAEGSERIRLLAEAARRGFALPAVSGEDPPEREEFAASGGAVRPGLRAAPTARFAIVDRNGMAVACGLTTNGLFGAGRIAPGTGIVLAALPEPDRAPAIAPVVLVDRDSKQFFMTAVAGGGQAAPSALAAVLLALLDGERPLGDAVAAPRLHHDRAAGSLLVESGLGGAARAALETEGRRVVEVPAIGRVSAIHCPEGLPRAPGSCRSASDRRPSGPVAGEPR